ncbi:xylose isomerase-like protein [Rhodocollybia butyracea]|uniref:Xylose isomerase-like protein n=1 Tax=Rhodocollybia butyracea TaxID=206335 RepID=A0A9P5PGK3_9AGAR|nr:xylose isomerase-like protein [Rhodocollybia butyracea]
MVAPLCSYPRPKFAIASLSLGTSTYHDLPTKIYVTSELGYDGIEIFTPDFESFVDEVREGKHAELFDHPITSLSPSELDHACAIAIHNLCESLDLEIPLFQPFRNFENFRSQEHVDVGLTQAKRWLRIMRALQCDLLLVCSNYISSPHPISEEYTAEMYRDAQVDAFRQLGELAEEYGVRIGYEPLSWGTVINNWMQVWDIVKRVDRDNVGVLLDSFNTLGNQYADPGQPSTIRKGQTLANMLSNLEEMSLTVPAEKIFFYQVADAIRPADICHDDSDMPGRMKWSRACRVFPCEPPASESDSGKYDPLLDLENPTSGYLGFLPVTQMTSFVHRAGYRGWWSLEVFNTSLQESDRNCPERHARRGISGLRTLWEIIKANPLCQTNGVTTLKSEPGTFTSSSPPTPPLSIGSDSGDSTASSDVESEVDLLESDTESEVNLPGIVRKTSGYGDYAVQKLQVERSAFIV